MVHLSFTAGALAGRSIDLGPGRYIVGRRADAQVQVPDRGVSGHHAAIDVGPDGRVCITDLGSSNGTWVDGERITGTWLIGDRADLRFGAVPAVLAIADAAPAGGRGAAKPRVGKVVAALAVVAVVLAGVVVLAQALRDDEPRSGARANAATAGTPKPKPKPPTRAEILALANEATVQVSTSTGSGSGWVMAVDEGRPVIVTNAHVVGDATAVRISSDDLAPHVATVLGVSQCDDLAVVRADNRLTLRRLTVAAPAEVGDEVWIAGFPGRIVDENGYQLHVGRIASVGATLLRHDRNLVASYRDLVQVDGVINPGNSGGPLLEQRDGRVVGVATFRASDPGTPQGYGIGAERLRAVLPYLAAGTSVPGMALGFDATGAAPEPHVFDVSSATLKRAGVTSDGGQRLVAIDGRRFDRNAFPNGLSSVCDALPELGDGKSETVRYTVRKPDGRLLVVPIDY